MPQCTPMRCRACTVLGGTTLDTDEEAEAVNEIPRVKLSGTTYKAGDFVSLPHCLKDDAELARFAKANGRPCPRVVLDPSNVPASNLVSMTIREDVRPFVGPYFEATHAAASSDTRRRMLARVALTVMDRDVTEALYPKREKGKA